MLKKGLSFFPYVRYLQARIAGYERYLGFEPGHYYSPLVEPSEYYLQQQKIFAQPSFIPSEISFDAEAQAALLRQFEAYYAEMPFGETPEAGYRYSFDNVFFTYSDAITMYSMMRHLKPRRIVEIGSGFSSALILDTNEQFFNGSIELTFIEPDPERLFKNLKQGERVNIIQQKIQDVDAGVFQQLEAGDFLLIDTSHVSKSGSDVNHIYFNILPYLKKGVKIHIHDIFFPFEYPEKWVIEGRSWNEVFLLRAFLAFNNSFSILYFNDFAEKLNRDFLEEHMPLMLKRNSTVCGGLWMEKMG